MKVDQPSQGTTAPQNACDTARPIVAIVDDEASVREALSELIELAGLQTVSFGSTRELLDSDVVSSPGCLILDVRMPGDSGLDLQQHLTKSGNMKPVIFLTGHGDIPMSVQAMKAGAVDFLTKPVRDKALLEAVRKAISLDAARRADAAIVKGITERHETLTPREREVLQGVTRGRLNKQIAFDLGIREVTVKLHRGNVMRKMDVTSLSELIRVCDRLPTFVREDPKT